MKIFFILFSLSLVYGQLSLEISTDTSFYSENQDVEVTLKVHNLGLDTICIVFPGSMPYWIYLDGQFIWGGGGFALLIPLILGPNESHVWNFIYDEYIDIGIHSFSATLEYFPACTSYDSITYINSNLAYFQVLENLAVSSMTSQYLFHTVDNYPNPFNTTAIIRYFLPVDSYVELNIFNLNGKKIKTLVKNNQLSGINYVFWDGTDDVGNPVSSSLYFYQIIFDNIVITKKMTLLK